MEGQGETRDLEALRAQQSRESSGRETPGLTEAPAQGVLTLVCETCGKYFYFSDAPPQAGMSCSKCSGTVFREFFTPVGSDQAAQDFEDTTGRDVGLDEPNPDTLPGDVIDINNP